MESETTTKLCSEAQVQSSALIKDKKELTVEDLVNLDPNTQSLSMIGCQSQSWNLLFDHLSTLQHLQSLTIENSNCSDCGSRLSVGKMVQLTSLTMKNCRLTDDTVQQLSKLPKLKRLNIELNYSISDDKLRILVVGLKQLEQLVFPIFGPGYGSFNSLELTSLQTKFIASNMAGLTNLNIRDNRLGSEGAELIGKHMSFLFNLDMSMNFISSEGAYMIGRLLVRLLVLQLQDNLINSEGALKLARNLRLVQQLNIHNNQINDLTLYRMRRLMPGTAIINH